MGHVFYFIKEALRGFFQAKLMTAVSITAIAVSLFILGAALVAAYNARLLFRQVSEQVDAVAYVQDRLGDDPGALAVLAGRIRQVAGVASVQTVDREQAIQRFKQAYGDRLLAAVDANPLPAAVEIRFAPGFRTQARAQGVVQAVSAIEGVEQMSWSSQWFGRLGQMRNWLTAGAVALAVVSLLILQFIVSNTVKLTIYARRELVDNMRYLGATDTFIRTPFILEGIIQGFLGACIGLAALYALRPVAGPVLLGWGPSFLAAALLSAGVVFGWSGSSSAVRKFLQ